jgi:hypothetical protein
VLLDALRRLGLSALLVLGLLTGLFFGVRLLPGDPLGHWIDVENLARGAAQMRHQLHLDEPLPVQYVHWMVHCCAATWGRVSRPAGPSPNWCAKRCPIRFAWQPLRSCCASCLASPSAPRPPFAMAARPTVV